MIGLLLLGDGDGDGHILGVCLAAVGAGDGDGGGAGLLAVHHIAVNGNDGRIAGGVGELCALDLQKLGGNISHQLQSGIAGVGIHKLINGMVLDGKFSAVDRGGIEALVHNCHGQEAEEAIALGGLGVQGGDIHGADLAVVLAQPFKIAAVALGVGVGAGLLVQIVDIEVGEAGAGDLLDQRGDLEDGGGDVFGNGGVQDVLDGGFLDPALVKIVAAAIVVDQSDTLQLVAALIAEGSGVGGFAVQDPVGLGGGDGDLVADGDTAGQVAVVYIDRAGLIYQHHTAGDHAVGIGDPGDDAIHLYLGAFGGGTGIGDGHFGVLAFVHLDLGVGELDQAGVLDFLGAVVVLQDAVQQDFIALVGLVGHLTVGDLTVFAVGAIDGDGAGLIADDHGAVGGIGDGLYLGADIVALFGNVALRSAKLQSLGDGNGFVLRLGFLAGFGGFAGGLVGCRGAGCHYAQQQRKQQRKKLLHVGSPVNL